MFTLDLFPAREGDALILTWGPNDAPRRMLIDAGREKTAEAIKVFVAERGLGDGAFELFVITHIDRDHIEGAVPLLRDAATSKLFKTVWFNDRQDLDWRSPDDRFEVFGALDGVRVGQALRENKVSRNDRWEGRPVAIVEDRLPSFEFPDGLTLTLLSPDLGQLAALAEPWDETIEAAPAGWEQFGEDEPLAIEHLATRAFKGDRAKPNGSSIALIAEYDGRRILLSADAHSPRLLKSLALYQASPRAGPITLVKAPHHGSRANVSSDLVKSTACAHWVFSTNGDQFKHPDSEAVARAIWHAPSPPTLYFNYETAQTKPWKGKVSPHRDFHTRYGSDGRLTIDIAAL